jgi:hypothetical protein
MSKKPIQKRDQTKHAAAAQRRMEGPQIVTPEGDPLVEATEVYDHSALGAIRQRLEAAADFERDRHAEAKAGHALSFIWLQTGGARSQPPAGQRILALLTLTPVTLEVTTLSRRRQAACRRRLTRLLGPLIRPVSSRVRTVDDMLREPPPPQDVPPPVVPPELRAQMEEQMLRSWLDESIPALGGLSPRQAAKTREGRQAVLDLIAYITRQQDREHMPPSLISPDYRKAKKLLGL